MSGAKTHAQALSIEASAKGTSTESANGTTVLLTGEPHETQNEPQDSLPLTPRLPTEGKPDECKQEAAESVVTAGRTNGTVGMTEPHETVADIDGKAAPGRELAERVHVVDEGTETERDSKSQLQQTNFYCEEDCQRNANANADVPSAYKLPLEGEWTVYASGEDKNSDADGPSESKETEGTAGVESEGCRGTSERVSAEEAGTDVQTPVECCQQSCMADGDGDREVEPADIPNESETLVIASIESESPDGGGIPRVHLGSTSWRAGDANGPGNQADASRGQADGRRGWTDTLDVSNNAGMSGMTVQRRTWALGTRNALYTRRTALEASRTRRACIRTRQASKRTR